MSQSHDPVLDAARECVLAVGVRRTTFSDVARRAGVSRMTLYRRFGDLEALLSALMTREFGRLVAAAQPQQRAAARASGPCGMVVGGARRLAADPLFQRLLDVDPELLLPYVTTAPRRHAADGRHGADRGAAATATARCGRATRRRWRPPSSWPCAGSCSSAHADEPPDWAELERMVDSYLAP